MTLGQMVDLALGEITQYRTAINIDWTTTAFFVNRAIQELFVKTSPFADWKYVTSLRVTTNPYRLPNGSANLANSSSALKYHDKIRLLCSIMEGAEVEVGTAEARYCDPKEFFYLSDWRNKSALNKATYNNPIYTIWGDIPRDMNNMPVPNAVSPQSTLWLYIAPYNNVLFNNLPNVPPSYIKSVNNVNALPAVFDCYCMPGEVTRPTDFLPIPYEFEGLIKLYTVSRLLSKFELNDKLVDLEKIIKQQQNDVFDTFMKKESMKERVVESFSDQSNQVVLSQSIKNVEAVGAGQSQGGDN